MKIGCRSAKNFFKNFPEQCVLLFANLFFTAQAVADLKTWTLTPEITTAGSAHDRVLWNFRPAVNAQWETALFERDDLSFHFDGKLRADTQQKFVSTGQKYEFRVNKAYLQWQGNKAGISLGMQRLTWGDSAFLDGVDMINPRDLTEPLYADDETVKLAVPAVNLQYLGENTIFQIVLTLKAVRSPVRDNLNGTVIVRPKQRKWFNDLELAFKAGGLLKNGWDVNGYLLSHFERLPQPVLSVSGSPSGTAGSAAPQTPSISFRLNEPRVFTLGLTGTQSSGDFVFRAEGAIHFDRALPDISSRVAAQSEQFVVHWTTDYTFAEDVITTFEIWDERWTSRRTSSFYPEATMLGVRIMKPFFERQFEPSAGVLVSADGREAWSFLKLNLKFFESAQASAEAHWAKTSTGRVLARRGLKNLIRSSVSWTF